MRSTPLALSLLIALSALSACSERDYYGLVQDNAMDTCRKMVDPDQRRDCLKKYDTSYESYKKDREAAQGARK